MAKFKLADKFGYVSPFEDSPFNKEWQEKREKEREEREETRQQKNVGVELEVIIKHLQENPTPEDFIGTWLYDLDGSWLGFFPDKNNEIHFIDRGKFSIAASLWWIEQLRETLQEDYTPSTWEFLSNGKSKQIRVSPFNFSYILRKESTAFIGKNTYNSLCKYVKDFYGLDYVDTGKSKQEIGGFLYINNNKELVVIYEKNIPTYPIIEDGIPINTLQMGRYINDTVLASNNHKLYQYEKQLFCIWHSHPPQTNGEGKANPSLAGGDIEVHYVRMKKIFKAFCPYIGLIMAYPNSLVVYRSFNEGIVDESSGNQELIKLHAPLFGVNCQGNWDSFSISCTNPHSNITNYLWPTFKNDFFNTKRSY